MNKDIYSDTTIDEGCFYGCGSLEEVIFADDSKLRRISNRAFACSGLKNTLMFIHDFA